MREQAGQRDVIGPVGQAQGAVQRVGVSECGDLEAGRIVVGEIDGCVEVEGEVRSL